MRLLPVWILALLCAGAGAAAAAGTGGGKLAWFQERNIFHSGLRGAHTLALTFDDGPNARTGEVLDVLKAEHIPATFFIVGRMAHLHPAMLKRIAAEGHLLANHTASHRALGEAYVEEPDLLLDEIRDVDDQIRPLMPERARFFFRAPYGAWRPEHAQALNADPVLKQYVGPIYWDEGGQIAFRDDGAPRAAADWQCWKERWEIAECAAGYLNDIARKNGGVVLMHCVQGQSAQLLAMILPVLIDEGFAFVRLDDVRAYRKYETPPDEGEAAVAMNVKPSEAARR